MKIAMLAVVITLGGASTGLALTPAPQKTTLQDAPFPPPSYHTVTVRTVIAPGGQAPPHTHPGLETAYIIGGQALVTIAGRPEQTLGAGGSFSVGQGAVHSVRNTGRGDLTILSTYVVEKNKPIMTPAGAR